MLKNTLLILLLPLLLIACSDRGETTEQNKLRELLIELTQMVGEEELKREYIDKAFNEAASLGLKDKERDWFVRSYLIYRTVGKEADTQAVYKDSQLRRLYEETWQSLANERYGVELEEERLKEIIEINVTPVKEILSSDKEHDLEMPLYLAELLGYSIDEFFSIFDRHIYERWAISESLFPILEQEYKINDQQEISYKYRLEVIYEIVRKNENGLF